MFIVVSLKLFSTAVVTFDVWKCGDCLVDHWSDGRFMREVVDLLEYVVHGVFTEIGCEADNGDLIEAEGLTVVELLFAFNQVGVESLD